MEIWLASINPECEIYYLLQNSILYYLIMHKIAYYNILFCKKEVRRNKLVQLLHRLNFYRMRHCDDAYMLYYIKV